MKRIATVLGLSLVSFLAGCAGAKETARSAAAPSEGVVGAMAPVAEAAPAAAPAAPGMVAAEMAPAGSSASAKAAAATSTPTMPIARDDDRRVIRNQAGLLTAGVWDDNRNFDFWKPYQAGFVREHGQDFAMFSAQELVSASQVQASAKSELDVQLVLDTTGSMGDERSYLQTELDAIVGQLRTKLPNVTPRFSLVVYRDRGDDYVTRPFDFTTDTNKFRATLNKQSAGGGGDEPEAVVEGLGDGLRQSWRRGANVARMAFWVADAPAHNGEGQALAKVIRRAKETGVKIYPIASSDTSPAAEYQMRSAAQMTGGRYVFLTGDSGVGNDHAEPHIPCYSVTRLDTAMVRMIENEMTGRHVEPEANQVLRAVGKPNAEGKCTTSSGMLVASF